MMSIQRDITGKNVIRPMEAGDIDSIFEIYRSLIGEERAIIDTDLIVSDPGGTLDLSFVAEVDGEVTGFIVARHTYIGEPPVEAGLIQGLGVHPLHQRTGIATRLVNTLTASSRAKGIKTLRVMLSERDSQLEGFFRRMNFQPARLVIYDMSL
jgi:predicted N-acetyltransferase YhbS